MNQSSKALRNSLIWLGIIVLFLMFVSGVRAVLLPFVLGVMLAYFLDPLVDRLQLRRLNRNVGTAVVTVLFFAFCGGLLAIAIPLIAEQLIGFLEALPDYIHTLSAQLQERMQAVLSRLPEEQETVLADAIRDFSGKALGLFSEFMQTLFASGASILNILSLLLITPVVTFYMLRDWDQIITRLDALLPRDYADVIRQQMKEIDWTIGGFIRGQVMVCCILALFYVICLTAAGLQFSLVIGTATGFLIIIPYVGWFAGAVAGMIVAFLQYDSHSMIALIAAIFLIGQVIESYFLTPQLIGERVGLHPLWMIFGMLSGGALLGFVGVLLAVPLTAVIGVLTRFVIARYLQSALYHGHTHSS